MLISDKLSNIITLWSISKIQIYYTKTYTNDNYDKKSK